MLPEKSEYWIPPTRLEAMEDDAWVIAEAVRAALEKIPKPPQ